MQKLVNFRDLGGIAGENGKIVKPKRLLRASALWNLDKRDAQSLLEEYELRNIVDLRSEQETKTQPDDKLPGITYIHLDVSGDIQSETPSMRDIMKYLHKESASKMMRKVYRNLVLDEGTKGDIENMCIFYWRPLRVPLYFTVQRGKTEQVSQLQFL